MGAENNLQNRLIVELSRLENLPLEEIDRWDWKSIFENEFDRVFYWEKNYSDGNNFKGQIMENNGKIQSEYF